MKYTLPCPVCGEEVDFFDVCDNCDWENRGPGEEDDGFKGPNTMTLSEARELYNKKNN